MDLIRQRYPMVDDITIYRMIKLELVPNTSTKLDPKETSLAGIKDRLNKMSTYVIARNKRTFPYGFISFSVRNHQLLIDMLAIEHAHQGRGWGSRLLEAAEQHGVRRGCREARLYVDESNTGAIRFYERHGYMISGYNREIKCYHMMKIFMSHV